MVRFFGMILAYSVLVHLLVVIAWDAIAFLRGERTVTHYISHSWIAMPTAALLAAVMGIIVVRHFLGAEPE